MSTGTLTRPQLGDPALEQGEGHKTHIVKQKDNKSATAIVMEAMVEGTPVEAMCGHIWVPSRDPKRHPMCEACKEAVDAAEGAGYSDGVNS